VRLLADESLPVDTCQIHEQRKVFLNSSIISFFQLSSDKITSFRNSGTSHTVTDDNQALSSAISKLFSCTSSKFESFF
jgi:hypothetical protein